MESANTGGFRLVRCPKCYNILPEPPNVSVYQCGGCNSTLKAKIRVSNGGNVMTKQIRQNSYGYSVFNGVPPQNKEPLFTGVTVDCSCTPDAPSSDENGDVMSSEKNVKKVVNTDNKEDFSFDVQDMDGKIEAPADELIHSNLGGTLADSDNEENKTVEPSKENSEASGVRRDGDNECSQIASDHSTLSSDGRTLVAADSPDSEQNAACKTEPAAATRSTLARVQSRSCDLRVGSRLSAESLEFHSCRTSFQSTSFRASEPLESKIKKTVDDLRCGLSEIVSKPSDFMARPHAAITSNLPLTAYHPSGKHSGVASRLSRSGQVAPRALPLRRYRRRHGTYSYCHGWQMETRTCPRGCCHGCRPPCCSSWKQEPALQKPPAKETQRRPPPRNLCRPVLRGAPFVLCSNCLRLVQLPTDFLVPSKRTRRLQCGSCSEILSYSYRDPSRKKKLQSQFAGDEHCTDGYEIHRAANEHSNGAAAHQAEPCSYSEEHGLSAGPSCSTEDEQPLHVSRSSSFDTIDGTSGTQSKLHRLMGYTSASELLRHSPDLYESFSRRTPTARTYDAKGKGVYVSDNDDSGGEHWAVEKSRAGIGGLPFQVTLKRGIHGS